MGKPSIPFGVLQLNRMTLVQPLAVGKHLLLFSGRSLQGIAEVSKYPQRRRVA